MFIVGDSGSGRSTLIKLIMKELEPTSGTIIVNGNNLSRMKHRKVAMYRKISALYFRDFRLLKDRNIYENIAFLRRVTRDTYKRLSRKSTGGTVTGRGLPRNIKAFPKGIIRW